MATVVPPNTRRAPPDFTFPPRYSSSQNSSESSSKDINTPNSFSRFKQYTESISDYAGLELARQASQQQTNPSYKNSSIPTPKLCNFNSEPSTFLSIPLEIRLQIYSLVVASHPIFHAHLAPPLEPSPATSSTDHLPKTEEFHTSIARVLGTSNPTSWVLTASAPASKPQEISALYPISSPAPARPSSDAGMRGKIPSGLLCSCRQVYQESRMVPWEHNTFSFINWFWSGVYAARQFTRALRPWQSEGMRWVGVEVLGRDLNLGGPNTSALVCKWGSVVQDGNDKSVSEWGELCGLWKGVWGLRLGVKGSVLVKKEGNAFIEENEVGIHLSGSSGPPSSSSNEPIKKRLGSILDIGADWVSGGLLQMKNLRWIELEIEDEDVPRADKLLFCAELELVMNNNNREKDWNGDTRVVFVERRQKEDDMKKSTGGELRDDSGWGLNL